VGGEKGGVLGVSILTRGHCFLADPLQPSASWRATAHHLIRLHAFASSHRAQTSHNSRLLALKREA